MIRINLLPDGKLTTSDRGRQSLLIGVFLILGLAALAYFFLYQPAKEELAELKKSNQESQKDITQFRKTLDGDKKKKKKSYDEIKKVYEEEQKRVEKIKELDDARVVPSHVLRELSRIMTRDTLPKVASYSPAKDGEIDPKWDPKRVWLTEVIEQRGMLTIKGGGQTPSDASQLASRMRVSIYFEDVRMPAKRPRLDSKTKTKYTEFEITAKVVY